MRGINEAYSSLTRYSCPVGITLAKRVIIAPLKNANFGPADCPSNALKLGTGEKIRRSAEMVEIGKSRNTSARSERASKRTSARSSLCLMEAFSHRLFASSSRSSLAYPRGVVGGNDVDARWWWL